jgi:hypothetical protein
MSGSQLPVGYSAETTRATWISDGDRGRVRITHPVLTFLTDPEGTERAYDHRAEAVGAALQMEAQNMPYTARDSHGQVVQAATVAELTVATTAAQRSEFASWTVRETDSEAPGGSRYVGYINGGLLISAEQMDAEAEAHVDDQAAALDEEMPGPDPDPDAEPERASARYDPEHPGRWREPMHEEAVAILERGQTDGYRQALGAFYPPPVTAHDAQMATGEDACSDPAHDHSRELTDAEVDTARQADREAGQ